ncbi:hypothetical protein [Agrilutibacter solisilvae]|uniref:Uncharacterized protein n=1 Tax=Agrilutibacter solisilvae TaxID=2763317 RepID=A0A974XYN4_9GAMM|nr:hypothetical protein [Lysobacter solisilvae]QSX78119.1 hypothetical protein I8J32_015690 [Lysobacter solisilvae]
MKVDAAFEKLLPREVSRTWTITKGEKSIEVEIVLLRRRLLIGICTR